MGKPKSGKQAIELTEKRREALKLRKSGATYDHIAATLGYKNRGAAYKCVMSALKVLLREPGEELREEHGREGDGSWGEEWTRSGAARRCGTALPPVPPEAAVAVTRAGRCHYGVELATAVRLGVASSPSAPVEAEEWAHSWGRSCGPPCATLYTEGRASERTTWMLRLVTVMKPPERRPADGAALRNGQTTAKRPKQSSMRLLQRSAATISMSLNFSLQDLHMLPLSMRRRS